MYTISALVCVIAATVASGSVLSSVDAQTAYAKFQAFKQEFGRQYADAAEESQRFALFVEHLRNIDEWNREAVANGYVGADGKPENPYGVTLFADLTDEEQRRYTSGSKLSMADLLPTIDDGIPSDPNVETGVTASEVDWRTSGAVTEARQQNPCNDCWAYAATGALEALYTRQTKKQAVPLSVQNLVDCIKGGDCQQGDNAGSAFNWVKTNGGIDTEAKYPTGTASKTCKYSKNNTANVKVTSGVKVVGGEIKVQQTVGTIGPIAVRINGNSKKLKSFTGSGIFPAPDDCACTNASCFNHEVLVIGFGDDNFLIKNSWGKSWGSNGFGKFPRDAAKPTPAGCCGIGVEGWYPA